jgi:hypothetical protein
MVGVQTNVVWFVEDVENAADEESHYEVHDQKYHE